MTWTTLQQVGIRLALWAVWQSLALEIWSTSICYTRRKRGRISILVLINFNGNNTKAYQWFFTIKLDLMFWDEGDFFHLLFKHYEQIHEHEYKCLIQQFWIQEIKSKIYLSEQRNMIVNQVPMHQFWSKWGIM